MLGGSPNQRSISRKKDAVLEGMAAPRRLAWREEAPALPESVSGLFAAWQEVKLSRRPRVGGGRDERAASPRQEEEEDRRRAGDVAARLHRCGAAYAARRRAKKAALDAAARREARPTLVARQPENAAAHDGATVEARLLSYGPPPFEPRTSAPLGSFFS